MPVDWDDLIAKVRKGDWRAEDLCFKESKALLWSVYRNRNWQWKMPEDFAESIMHVSIAKAMRMYKSGKYPSYLVTIFIHDVTAEELRPRRLILVSIDDDVDGPKQEPPDPIPFIERILAREEWEILLDCLRKLSPDRKECLELRLEGWTPEEIGEIITDKSIKDLLHHAKLEVQKCFERRVGSGSE